MEELKKRIIKDGTVIGNNIVKVDSFLNHQVDTSLLEQMAHEFYELFKNKKVNKILTIESSGISVAAYVAKYFNYCPLVFAKKSVPNTMNDDFYYFDARSFTKGTVNRIIVSKKYINKDDNILIIDDFLAHGEALKALTHIVEEGNAKVEGIGIVISKNFQKGYDTIKSKGYDLKVLAPIKSIENGIIEFEE